VHIAVVTLLLNTSQMLIILPACLRIVWQKLLLLEQVDLSFFTIFHPMTSSKM